LDLYAKLYQIEDEIHHLICQKNILRSIFSFVRLKLALTLDKC